MTDTQESRTHLYPVFRTAALSLKALDPRSVQALIRECEMSHFEAFLWYAKDAELISLFLSNCSSIVVEMVMESFENDWYGKNPEKASDDMVERGQNAVRSVLNAARTLAEQGDIPALPEATRLPDTLH